MAPFVAYRRQGMREGRSTHRPIMTRRGPGVKARPAALRFPSDPPSTPSPGARTAVALCLMDKPALRVDMMDNPEG